MAVNTAEIGLVFDALELKAKSSLDEMFNSYEITADGKANILSQMIVTLIQTSASTVQSQPIQDAQVSQITSQVSIAQAQSAKDLLTKQSSIDLQSAQKNSIDSEKVIKEAQSAKDLLLKDSQKIILDQQKLTEMQRTAQLVQSVSEATAKQAYNITNTQKQGALLEGQAIKLTADTALVGAQQGAITQQVIDNRKIKVFDTLGETYGTVGAGGLTVSSEMWTTFFTLGANLAATEGVTAPTTTTVTKVV